MRLRGARGRAQMSSPEPEWAAGELLAPKRSRAPARMRAMVERMPLSEGFGVPAGCPVAVRWDPMAYLIMPRAA
eukprot:2628227-Pleurochrysis_carterae.AAC.4